MPNTSAIKAERVRAGFSQEEMARELNCSTNTYNLKENGKASFTLPEVLAFCKAVGLSDPLKKASIFLI